MKEEFKMTRRELLAAAAALTVSSILPRALFATQKGGEMPQRTLGRTGEKVSVIGLGGYHLGMQEEKESIAIMRRGIDNGITFLDNCCHYHDGESERRMGKALRDGYRHKVFLMTKIDGREKQAAARQIDGSLRRLQTDRIDLMQFHEIIHENDPERIFGSGGGMEAMLAAQKAGKVRYIGFTGHKSPEIHLKMLQTAFQHDFRFDAVQMPLNVMDAHFRSFEKKVLPVLLQHNIAVLGMKSMGSGILLQSKAVSAIECLQYAMSLPTSVVITGCDSQKVLDQALHVARGFKPLSEAQVVALLSRTASAAKGGEFERYKVSHEFDGTVLYPEWMVGP